MKISSLRVTNVDRNLHGSVTPLLPLSGRLLRSQEITNINAGHGGPAEAASGWIVIEIIVHIVHGFAFSLWENNVVIPNALHGGPCQGAFASPLP